VSPKNVKDAGKIIASNYFRNNVFNDLSRDKTHGKTIGVRHMIRTSRRHAARRILMVAFLVAAAPALAQQPTDAQRSAIRSACRSDYMAHCSSVPPGGLASLQCLQKNMSSLAPSCQSAVNAVAKPSEPAAASEPPASAATPKAETPAAAEPAKPAETSKPAAAATAAPKAAASPAAKKPSSAQVSAMRSACRSDYMRSCAGVRTGGAAALSCLEKHKSTLSPGCQQAVSAVSGGSAPAAGASPTDQATAPAGAAAPAPALVLRPMLPREELFVARTCGGDIRALCTGVPAGGGRLMRCLAANASSLSPSCSDVLGQFSAAQ
jgi:hypothetical protein